MDKHRNFYKVNSTSKTISRTPAQDRLKALQNRLQKDLKTEIPTSSFNYNNLLQDSHTLTTYANIKKYQISQQQTTTNNGKTKYSGESIQNRLKPKQSNKKNESFKITHQIQNNNKKSTFINKLTVHNKSNTQNKKESACESKSESSEPSRSKLSSIWKSMKNFWNSDEKTKEFDNKLQNSQNKVNKTPDTKPNNEKNVELIQNKNQINIKSNNGKNQNTTNDDPTKINIVKFTGSTNEISNFLNNSDMKHKYKVSQKNVQLINKNDKIKQNILEIENKMNNFKNKNDTLASYNNSPKNNSFKRSIEESNIYNECNKKRKSNPTDNQIYDCNVQSKNEYHNNICPQPIVSKLDNIEKKSNAVILLSPVPGKKFSANNRLQHLREQLLANQTSDKFNVSNKIKENTKDATTDDKITDNIKYTNEFKLNSNVCNENDSDSLENYETVNINLEKLIQNNRNVCNEFEKDSLYIIPDTNVFIHDFTFLKDLVNSKLCDTKRSIVFVPYIVLQELDRLKLKTNDSISVKVNRAIKFLNENFSKKNANYKGQSALESKKHYVDIQSGDDQIINCCLQLKLHNVKYILLTNDINLKNKAICNQIICSSKSDLESDY